MMFDEHTVYVLVVSNGIFAAASLKDLRHLNHLLNSMCFLLLFDDDVVQLQE